MKAPYTIELTQLDDRSILVRVGCKTLSYQAGDPQMLDDLVSYFADPEGAIRRFSAGFGWKLEPTDAPYDPRRSAIATLAGIEGGGGIEPPRNIGSEAVRDRA